MGEMILYCLPTVCAWDRTARTQGWVGEERWRNGKERNNIVAVEPLPVGVIEKVEELANQFEFQPLVLRDGVEDFLN